jgi:hypothetical protein
LFSKRHSIGSLILNNIQSSLKVFTGFSIFTIIEVHNSLIELIIKLLEKQTKLVICIFLHFFHTQSYRFVVGNILIAALSQTFKDLVIELHFVFFFHLEH